jgi:transposase-like protein
MRRKKSYSRYFKLSAIKETEVLRDIEVCRKYGVASSLLYKWKKEYQKNPDKAFQGEDDSWRIKAENERYKIIIGELYSEIDLLKKTTGKLQEMRKEKVRCSK